MENMLSDFKIELKELSFYKQKSTNRKIIFGRSRNGVLFRGEFQGKKHAIKKILFAENNEETIKLEIVKQIKLIHPNLLKILAWTEDSEAIFLVIEYFSGVDLKEYLKTNQSNINVSNKLEILIQVADTLEYLHRLNTPIIHNEIKTQNVLISKDGKKLRLVDFLLNKDIKDTVNTSKEPNWSPAYLPPELLNNMNNQNGPGPSNPSSNEPTTFSDVYQFGMLVYEVLSGDSPFEKETIKDNIFNYICKGGRPNLKILGKDVPSDLIKLIKSCWSQKAGARPKISEIKQELEKINEKVKISNVKSKIYKE